MPCVSTEAANVTAMLQCVVTVDFSNEPTLPVASVAVVTKREVFGHSFSGVAPQAYAYPDGKVPAAMGQRIP